VTDDNWLDKPQFPTLPKEVGGEAGHRVFLRRRIAGPMPPKIHGHRSPCLSEVHLLWCEMCVIASSSQKIGTSPSRLTHRANDCLAAGVDVHVLDGNFLLALPSMAGSRAARIRWSHAFRASKEPHHFAGRKRTARFAVNQQKMVRRKIPQSEECRTERAA
jgi:hypothetical protein